MEKKFIVEVTALCDPENLDASELDADEQTAVEGSYRITLDSDLAQNERSIDHVFDIFQSVVPIACLEDYMIVVRNEGPHDSGQDWLRADLGVHTRVPDVSAVPGLEV